MRDSWRRDVSDLYGFAKHRFISGVSSNTEVSLSLIGLVYQKTIHSTGLVGLAYETFWQPKRSGNLRCIGIAILNSNKFQKNLSSNTHNALSPYIYVTYAPPINLDRLWGLDIIRQPW